MSNKKGTIAQRVRALAKRANGKRPLVMATYVLERRRRHRHAEATDTDRIHNASYDDDMREHHCDGDDVHYAPKQDSFSYSSSHFADHMAYTWEESDRMFDKVWHGESE